MDGQPGCCSGMADFKSTDSARALDLRHLERELDEVAREGHVEVCVSDEPPFGLDHVSWADTGAVSWDAWVEPAAAARGLSQAWLDLAGRALAGTATRDEVEIAERMFAHACEQLEAPRVLDLSTWPSADDRLLPARVIGGLARLAQRSARGFLVLVPRQSALHRRMLPCEVGA